MAGKPSKAKRQQAKDPLDPVTGTSSTPPSPFELTLTAIALCHLHKDDNPAKRFGPTMFLGDAAELLAKAKAYLGRDHEARRAEIIVAWGHGTPDDFRKTNRRIPFEDLLRPTSKAQGDKKPRTLLGTITTQQGLEKALRRYFPRDSARIIKAKAMTWDEWQHLRKAQKGAIQVRAGKRVKGPGSKKTQPA